MRKFEVGDLIEATVDAPAIGNGERFFVTGLDCDDNVMFIDSDGNKRLRRPEGFRLVERAEPSLESDPINHPAHYAGSNGIECIDAMRATLTPDEFRGYCKGAALKYIWRERQKGGNDSLAKAVWYLNEAQK